MSIVKYSILLLLLVGLFCPQRTTRPTLEQSEYEVYSTVILNLSLNLRNGPLMIKDHTELVGPATIIDPRQFPNGAFEDFMEKNQHPVKLQEQFSIPYEYHLISKDEDDGYGYIVVGLSRVGFNSSKNRSLVYVTYTMGGHNTKERYFALTKTGDRWVVQGTLGVLKKTDR